MAIRWPWVWRKTYEAQIKAAADEKTAELKHLSEGHTLEVSRLRAEHRREMDETTKAVMQILPKLVEVSGGSNYEGYPDFHIKVDLQGNMVRELSQSGMERHAAKFVARHVEGVLLNRWPRILYVDRSGRRL